MSNTDIQSILLILFSIKNYKSIIYFNRDSNNISNWVKDVQLRSYTYILIPLSEHFHWFLFLVKQPNFDAHAPTVVTLSVLDSLNFKFGTKSISNLLVK